MNITSKQRAYLRSLAQREEALFQLGKSGLTPEFVTSVDEALEKRELIKISLLKNCDEDIREVGQTLSERTRSVFVQTVGRKITLYRPAKKPVIELPR